MNISDQPVDERSAAESIESTESIDSTGSELLTPLLRSDVSPLRLRGARQPIQGVVIGELLALIDEGSTPLVRFSGQTGIGAVRARSGVQLHGSHIGGSVILMFENADPDRPVVIGVLLEQAGWPSQEKPSQVDVSADGRHLIVSAKEQLVLRCGKASITLTKAGKVLIEGAYVLSRSTGANRIKGGSVQLN